MGIPASPEDYCIEPPCEQCGADAEVNAQLHAAHFSQPQAQMVYDLAAQKLLPLIVEAAAQYEADRQREKLAQHYGSADRFGQVAAQLKAWGSTNLPPAVFQALSSTAEGVLAMEQMMQRPEPTLGRDVTAPTPTTEAELRAMMRDPRYWRAREPAFVQRVTEGFRTLVGATPTLVQSAELAQAFATGVVQAQVTSAQTGVDTSAWDYCKVFTPTGFTMTKNAVFMSRRAFQGLSREDQAMVRATAAQAEDRGYRYAEEAQAAAEARLIEKGMTRGTIPPAVMAELKKISDTMAAEWVEKTGEDGRKLLAAYRASA